EKDADPEDKQTLRTLRFRDRAPSSPAALAKAGVKFAFYSGGITTPKDIVKAAKKSIDAGLAADAALRALTLSPAEIFGVADRLGSIENGKIANLVVADGDIFEEKTKIKMVFVDGHRFEIREPEKPKEPPKGDITGKWKLSYTTPEGPEESTAELSMDKDGAISGSITSKHGTATIISGYLSADKFSFTILTVSHGAIEHGSSLIKDGKIAEVGQSIKAPKDAQVIDAAGQFVMPGIIDCHSHIAAESINEGSVSVSSMVNMAEILNPDDIDIYRDLAGGVTSANILHGSANSIGGQTLVIKLRWGQPAAKLPFEGAVPGIKFALGENPKRSNFSIPGQPRRYPATRMGVAETI